MLVAVTILNQGCSSPGELPTGQVWYKPGASGDQTQLDWLLCQQRALQDTMAQTTPNQFQTTPNPPPTSSITVQPNAYGLGVNADQSGRPTTYQLQNGQQLEPIFNNGVKQNAYGPGIGQDQFGRPIYNAPYGNDMGQGTAQGNDGGGQAALNVLAALGENHRAKNYMIAEGYSLVGTNSSLVINRPLHGF
jgi:hypothetical protein